MYNQSLSLIASATTQFLSKKIDGLVLLSRRENNP